MAKSDKKADKPAGLQELQQATDKANAQGFWGEEVDKTPDANYTLAGQVAGKPTPETDAKTAAKATE